MTDPFRNTVDIGSPSSAVDALPDETPGTTVTVSWSGHDENGAGSGIAYYDVYVSENSNEFQLWQDDITATSATFTGAIGHTYSFYSMATDNVGHQESVIAAAQATTTLTELPVNNASIHGRKFHDRNADGVRDSNEEWLNDWTIELLDMQGNVVQSTVTMDHDIDGSGAIDSGYRTRLVLADRCRNLIPTSCRGNFSGGVGTDRSGESLGAESVSTRLRAPV